GELVKEVVYSKTYTGGLDGQQHTFACTQTNSVLGATQGSPVGYREVVEKFGAAGEFGKIRYTYRGPSDAPDSVENSTTKFPYIPWTSYDWKRGQMLSSEVYNAAGGCMKKTKYTYVLEAATNKHVFSGYTAGYGECIAGHCFWWFDPYSITSAWQYVSSES